MNSCILSLYLQGKKEAVDPWDLALRAHLSEQPIDWKQLTDLCLSYPLRNPGDGLNLQRRLLFLALLSKQTGNDHSLLQEIAQKTATFPIWKEFQLFGTLSSLNDHLLGRSSSSPEFQQFSSGAALSDWSGRWPELQLPKPHLSAELGILWHLYGTIFENPEFLLKAKRLAEWQILWLDHLDIPFYSLWLKESESTKVAYLARLQLLFELCQIKDKAFSLQQHLQGLTKSEWGSIPPLTALIAAYPATADSRAPAAPTPEDASLLAASFKGKDVSSAIVLSGANTGLGCYHKNHVRIVNMGPDRIPLGDCSYFGIFRTIEQNPKASRDIILKQDEKGFFIQGWTALQRYLGVSLNWIDVAAEMQDGCLNLIVHFKDRPKDLAFTFYINADEVLSKNGTLMQRGAINRYEGKEETLVFRKNGEDLTIESSVAGVQIMPLAGGDHFWGADFLVAFPLDPDQDTYSWKIT